MKEYPYPIIQVVEKTGSESFQYQKKALDFSVIDFWKWYASDLLTNVMRGVLAEFIVARALGLEKSLRVEWDDYDLITEDKLKIEVKSGAYIQSWDQDKISDIRFDIARKQVWDYEKDEYLPEFRPADVYVFCLLMTKNQTTINPLDLDQWAFYVIPTSVLDAKIPKQKTIGLSTLKKLGCKVVTYNQLKDAINSAK